MLKFIYLHTLRLFALVAIKIIGNKCAKRQNKMPIARDQEASQFRRKGNRNGIRNQHIAFN